MISNFAGIEYLWYVLTSSRYKPLKIDPSRETYNCPTWRKPFCCQMHTLYLGVQKITGNSRKATNNQTILKNPTKKNILKNYKLYIPFLWIGFKSTFYLKQLIMTQSLLSCHTMHQILYIWIYIVIYKCNHENNVYNTLYINIYRLKLSHQMKIPN